MSISWVDKTELDRELQRTTQTLSSLIIDCVGKSPDKEFLLYEGHRWTLLEVYHLACHYARFFNRANQHPGDCVAVMLDNRPEHIAVIVALALTGAVWVPLDRRFTSSNVRRVLDQVPVSLVVAEAAYGQTIRDAAYSDTLVMPEELVDVDDPAPSQWVTPSPTDLRALLFTSGSTGPPKGVQVTEQMFLASGYFCALASDANDGEIFYLWEPLNHIGGAQLIPMALMSGATLALTQKFSVSRYWQEVVDVRATRLHYLGGIVDLLLQTEPGPLDRAHEVSLGFGAGARPDASKEFTRRFGIPLREVYGMTETSSFTTINFDRVSGSIGKALPWFDVDLVNDYGHSVSSGEVGEITLAVDDVQLITPGYYKNDAATRAAFRNSRFHTGDLARQDSVGNLYFTGRKKEIIRCKGEIVSPWEIESALRALPQITDAAVLGTETIGEQDIVAFIQLAKPLSQGSQHEVARNILDSLRQCLANFQIPRYIVWTEELPKTPTQRVEKHKLNVSVEGLQLAWDSQVNP